MVRTKRQKHIALTWFHVNVFPLHPHQVDTKRNHRGDETASAAPPDDWRSEQVVLSLCIAPSAHAQPQAHERPVERLGREDILLVRIRDEGVVRRHHRNVEMPEVAQERRLVELRVAGGNCGMTGSATEVEREDRRHAGYTHADRLHGFPRSSRCACPAGCSPCRMRLRPA